MVSVQERLKLKRVQIDTWSVKEQLCLASSVLRSGDQNWMSVSRSLRSFGEPCRPPDWFSQKSCAVQYSSLLEHVETPKRKKRSDKADTHVETPGESIVRKLTHERIDELKRLLQEDRLQYLKLKEDMMHVKTGFADDRLSDMWQQIDEEKRQKEKEVEAHSQWLKEREEKKLELERAWKPPVAPASPHRRKIHRTVNRRNSSQSEPSSEADSALDSPLSEPLNIDVIGEEPTETQVEPKPPPPTPTSPLLTSLLKSPSPAPTSQASSSILHSVITSHRGSSPTITSLLNSAPGIPGTSGSVPVAPPTTVSSSLKNLVSSAISGAGTEHHPTHAMSPAAGAPTLSMLLELPPSLPGKPLPELPSAAKPIHSVAIPPSTVANVPTGPGEVCHPEHQEMRVRRETGTDEPVEVVELECPRPTPDNLDLTVHSKEEPIEVLIEEVVVNDESVIESELLPAEIPGPSNIAEQQDKNNTIIQVDDKEDEDSNKNTNEEIRGIGDLLQKQANEEVFQTISHPSDDVTQSSLKKINNIAEDIDTKKDSSKEIKVIPEVEAGLSSGTVAEVIEITDDIQDGNLVTEVGGPVDGLADMEVIILDKVDEQIMGDVQIVDAAKDLECEVVEVVMGSHEKSEEQEHKSDLIDIEDDTERNGTEDVSNKSGSELQNQVSDIVQCEITESVSSVIESNDAFDIMKPTGDAIKVCDIVGEDVIEIETIKKDISVKEVPPTYDLETNQEEKNISATADIGKNISLKEMSVQVDAKRDVSPKESGRKDKISKDDTKKSLFLVNSMEKEFSILEETKKITAKENSKKDVSSKESSRKELLSKEGSKKDMYSKESKKELDKELVQKDVSSKEIIKKDVSSKELIKKDTSSKEIMKKDISSKEVNKKDISSQEITKKDISSKEIIKKDTSVKDGSKKDVIIKDSSKRDTPSKDSLKKYVLSKDSNSKKDMSSKDNYKKDLYSRDNSSKDLSAKDSSVKKDASLRENFKDSVKDISSKKDIISKDSSKRDTVSKDNSSKKDLSLKDSTSKKDTILKDSHSRKDIALKEGTRKDISKEVSKRDLAMKEDITKDTSSKELAKREIPLKDDLKPPGKEGSRKETHLKESFKKDLKDDVKKDISQKNAKDNQKDGLRKDVNKKEFTVKDNAKDKDSSSKESNKKEKTTSLTEDSKRSKDASKKDNLKDGLSKEGTKENVKKDTLKKDSRDELSRKDNTKRSLTREDRKESYARDELKKKLFIKEGSKKEGFKKVDSETRNTEASKSEVHVLKLDQNTGFATEELKLGPEGTALTRSEDDEGWRSRDSESKDLTTRVQAKRLVMEECRNDMEGTVSTSIGVEKLESVDDDEDDDESSKLDKELEKKENKEFPRLLEDTKHRDTADVMDEKMEKISLIRAETPSTEDDKTNDAEPHRGPGRKRLGAGTPFDSIPNSPASVTDEEREYRAWKKAIMLVYGRLATHKYASLFLRPITDDQAPGYSSVVYRPIDLLMIKKNIETGVTRTTSEFQRDVMLMFQNSIMYNKSSHFVHKMARQMQLEGMQHIQDFLTTQMLVQVVGEVPLRRETRTTEANKQRDNLVTPGSASQDESDSSTNIKRKRTQGSESERGYKKKKVDE